MTPRLLLAAPVCGLPLLCPPGAAAAAPWTCEASVVRGTLGPAPAIEPVTANQGASVCTTQSAGGTLPGGLLLGVTEGLLVVKRFKPRRNGTFRITLQGAKTRQVATFRFRTKVRFRVGNPHLLRTSTPPTYVGIG
jgi:hypothetical protein